MSQVRSAPGGVQTRVRMSDPRWQGADGWVKMSQRVNGVEIHYVRKGLLVDDFKFKYPDPPRASGGTQLTLPFD
jgi:filamentous hemagglutinin